MTLWAGQNGVIHRVRELNSYQKTISNPYTTDNLGAILSVMDWLCRASASGRIAHTGPPLTMRTLLTAIIKAYEIQGCYQMRNAFNSYGIDHVILVKLASAAVVSWLLGLTELQTMATISQVWMDGHPGRIYRSGPNTIPRKGWAAGDAGMRAVHLALLTRAGQPGAPTALTMPRWGFFANTLHKEGFELPKPFSSWVIQNIFFKVMPVEGHGISSVEAALIQGKRLRERGYEPGQITKVETRTTAAANLIISKQGPLYNAADRDHCIQYVIALAFLKGGIPEVQDYEDNGPWATSPNLESLRAKVLVSEDVQFTRDYLDLNKKSVASGLTVHLADGTILEEVLVEFPVGHTVNPQTVRFVKEKFSRNMSLKFSEMEVKEVLRAAENEDMRISDFVDLFVRQTPIETGARL